MRLCAALCLGVVALVVGFIVVRALPVLSSPSRGTLTGTVWNPDRSLSHPLHAALYPNQFGVLVPILDTFLAVGLALLLAVPIALALAIVITDTNPKLGRRFLRPLIELLIGIPSVVYGWTAYVLLVIPLLQPLAGAGHDGSGYIAAGIVLAVMVAPTIATLAADALAGLPPALREASAALGATQWQTLTRVLIPAARRGIISGVVLGMARAFGEALAVAMVIGGVNVLPDFSHQGARALADAGTTMTVTITDGINNLLANPDGTAARYLLALILLGISLASVTAIRAVNRRAVALT